MGKGERRSGRRRWTKAGRGPVLARTAALLLVMVGAYLAGFAQVDAVRWVAGAAALLGVVLLALLQRERLHRDQRQDELLQTILDSVPHILFYKDAGSRYLGINRVFEQTFGVAAEDVIGKRDADLFGQALHDRFVAQDRQLLASGEARTFDEEMPIDGEIHYIESRKTPFYDVRGNAIGIIGLAMDVTGHRRLRQQLEQSNAHLSVALRAAQMGAWTWEVGSDKVQVDPFAQQLFGHDRDEASVADVFGAMHPDDAEPVRMALRRALHESGSANYEFRAPDRDAGWRWFEASVMAYREPGRPVRLIGVNRDIDERKRHEL